MEELLSRCARWTLPSRGRSALCAVSGGLDSMCLLDLLDRWCRAREAKVVAAHFNHRLRGAESDRDERFVRDWCDAHDIAFVSCSGDAGAFAAREGLSLEEAARTLRYGFLRREAEKLGPHTNIYTAHHADDNAETILFNLIRGTGVAGLAGTRRTMKDPKKLRASEIKETDERRHEVTRRAVSLTALVLIVLIYVAMMVSIAVNFTVFLTLIAAAAVFFAVFLSSVAYYNHKL